MPETQATSPKLDLASGKDVRSRFGTSRASEKARPQQSRRERIIEGLKTLLWVAPLTALIWIWAEREQIATAEVQVLVEVRHVANDRVAILESPQDRQVILELSGPRASVDAVRDRLIDRPTLTVPVQVAAPFEGEVIGLAEIITRNNDIFTRNAVTVTRARTPVRISVENKRVVELPVQVRPGERPNGTFSFEPATVTVEGPASFFNTRERELAAYANMSSFASRPPGQYQEVVTVNLNVVDPPEGVSIRPPRSVKATVQIAGNVVKKTVSLRAFLVCPAAVLSADKVKLETEPQVPGVEVTGPAEVLEQLGEAGLGAYVEIVLPISAATEAVNPTGRKQYTIDVRPEHYRVPKEVTVLNPNRTFQVVLIPRPE